MKLGGVRPFVPSGKDYALSRAFFRELGFVENWGNDELCELQFGEARFLLQNYRNENMQQNYMVMVTVDDLDALHEHLQRLQLETRYPGVRFSAPEQRPWGQRELHLIDPAGVCWHFV